MFEKVLVCRPCHIQLDEELHDCQVIFWRSNWDDTDYLKKILSFHRHVYVERALVKRVQEALNGSDIQISPVPNFPRAKSNSSGKTAFLASNDTHVFFMLPIAKKVKNFIFIIPDRRNKNEQAAETLNHENLPFIELSYNVGREILDQFDDISCVFTGADWTSEYFALRRVLKGKKVPFVALQEGPQDWHMRFEHNDRLVIPNHYRNADISIMQGIGSHLSASPKIGAIIGNPKIDKFQVLPLPEKPLVMVNLNFAYLETKPDYEQAGGQWIADIENVLGNLRLDYFVSKHPRDETRYSGQKLLNSFAGGVPDQVRKASIVITRFSSIIYEALALGRPVIYYNPHGEPMPYLQRLEADSVQLANSPAELKKMLINLLGATAIDHQDMVEFLRFHAGRIDGNALKYIGEVVSDVSARSARVGLKHLKIADQGEGAPADKNDLKSVAIFSQMPPKGISGGRYHAIMLAHALKQQGHEVFLVIDNIPEFWRDFRSFDQQGGIRLMLEKNCVAKFDADTKLDVVIGVPGGAKCRKVLFEAGVSAAKHDAHLALLNFESGNWFNEHPMASRPLSEWDAWVDFASFSDCIISSCEISTEKAREFYTTNADSILFASCSPSVNFHSSEANAGKKKKPGKNILVFHRSTAFQHKGGDEFLNLPNENWRGACLRIIRGDDQPLPKALEYELFAKAGRYGFDVEIVNVISDSRKKELLLESDILLFPSYFEGFGLPPVEAVFFDVNVVCFDLPAIAEVCGSTVLPVPTGDWEAFGQTVDACLRREHPLPRIRAKSDLKRIRETYDRDSYGKRMNVLLAKLTERKPIPKTEKLVRDAMYMPSQRSFHCFLEKFWKFIEPVGFQTATTRVNAKLRYIRLKIVAGLDQLGLKEPIKRLLGKNR